nr:uroporphyrinogen decarboxylase family protein [Alkalibacter mobilis]
MKDAIELREPDRVPIFGLVDNWALSYNGTTLKEALADIEIEYQAYSKALTDFPFDAALAPGVTFPLNFVSSLGGGIYNNNMETVQIATGKSEIMSVDEYDDLIEDPLKFFRDVIIPRKHSIFQSGTTEEKFGKFANSISKFLEFGQSREMLIDRYKVEHGLPITTGATLFMPADIIMDYFRDFKGITSDIKRHPDKLAEACMSMLDVLVPYTFGSMMGKDPDSTYIQLFLHLPQFIRPKEFEKIYWPSFKKYINIFAAQGFKILILFEKNWEHLHEYLQELPKGSVIAFFEEDDLRVAKKKLGDNICIAGGLKTNNLYYSSKEECIDIAKGLVDDLAPGGGFVFSPDKVLVSANDARPENLKAVTEFITEYGIYK